MTGPDSEGLQAEVAADEDVDAEGFTATERAEALERYKAAHETPPTAEQVARSKAAARQRAATSPVVPPVGAVPVEVGSALARMLDKYLTTRGHTLSTAHLTGFEQLTAEADYILGEALELRDAIRDLASAAEQPAAVLDHLWLHAEREMADVVLATTTLAGMMPGKPTIESCIAEKTEADRDRG